MFWLVIILITLAIALFWLTWRKKRTPSSKYLGVDIYGFQLCVTMSPVTPLKYLERHLEVKEKVPTEKVPGKFGIWTRKLSPKYDFLNEGATMASRVGPIPTDGGDFLPYLKQLRRIVEAPFNCAPASIDEFLSRMERVRSVPSGKAYSGEDYIDELFQDDLQLFRFVVQESGNSVPKRLSFSNIMELHKQGHENFQQIIDAPDEVLLNLHGVGRKTLEKLRNQGIDINKDSI